jgi:hypothetical protein
MNIPEFSSRKELLHFIVKNKDLIIVEKKSQLKRSDSIVYQPLIISLKDEANKQIENTMIADIKDVMVKVVINTTNIIDSHMDLHLPGLWNKSLKENKNIYHLQEHEMEFKNIIASGKDLMAYTKSYTFAELGYNLPGTTEALIFESLVKADRNPFMCEQYKRGYVTNHSVGMRYVSIICCVNDEDYGAEYEAWNKYYPEIANKNTADEFGYFFAVKEAKVIEGSAVVIGSNYATPTLEVNESKSLPLESTDTTIIEPVLPLKKSIDYKKLTELFKNVKN